MKTLTKILIVLSGILLIIGGIYVLASPGATLLSMAWFLGLMVLMSGVMKLINYISEEHGKEGSGWLLFSSILDILFGIFYLGNNFLVASVLPFLFSAWVLVSGISCIMYSVDAKKFGFRLWWLFLVFGILMVLMGVSSIFEPMQAVIAMTTLIGVGFIVRGITTFIRLFRFGKFEKKVKRFIGQN